MKKLNIYLLSLVLLITVSCEFGDTNVNPANPLDVGVSALLPSLETGMSFAIGGEYTLFSNIMSQHIKGGTTAQQGDFTKYQLDGQDTDGMWLNMYTNALNISYLIIKKADEEGSPHYSGVAKVLMAYGLGVNTDTFGDIPYSTAFRADEGVIATYDSQQAIYTTIQTLLDEAIVELGAATSAASPGGDDLIYGGDLAAWTLAARSLKAKYYIHLSKVDAGAYSSALQAISDGVIASEAGNMQQLFVAGANNPRFEFDNNRAGNILMGDHFVNVLTANADPRLAQLNSINAGYYTSPASPVPYVTFAELKLIEAEALLFTGGAEADVRAALLAGADASIQTISGASDPAYLTALGTKFDAAITNQERLAVLMDEKYVVTYSTGMEGWVDFRRTGFPALSPNPAGVRSTNPGGGIPRRLPYAENERLLNTNLPFTEVNLQLRFYWDIE
jgi:hypothetical protein